MKQYNDNEILSFRKTCFVRKGGRNFQFSTISIFTKEDGYVGFGIGKSKYLSKSIDKARYRAKKNSKKLIIYGRKLKTYYKEKYCKTKLEFFPTKNCFKAGGMIRKILKKIKLKNVSCKNIGSRNIYNIIRVFVKFFIFTNTLYFKNEL
ncbi:hypothetical protein [Candidatus Vidania fulgoroideorum]